MTIGEKIKSKRLAADMTRKRLAELTGCQPDSIRQWEIGSRKPSYEQLLSITEVLNISYMELMREVEI